MRALWEGGLERGLKWPPSLTPEQLQKHQQILLRFQLCTFLGSPEPPSFSLYPHPSTQWPKRVKNIYRGHLSFGGYKPMYRA